MKKLLFMLCLLVSGQVWAKAPQMPEPSVLKTAEDYKKYEKEVVEAFKYIVQADPSTLMEDGVLPFALAWVSGSPYVSVGVHAEALASGENYTYSGEIMMVYISAMALAVMDGETDQAAVQLAGMNAVVNSYKKVKDKEKDNNLDKLLKLESKGKLDKLAEKMAG